MKKIIILLLVLATYVGTANAQKTTSGKIKLYVKIPTSDLWTSNNIHIYLYSGSTPAGTAWPGDLATQTTIDGETWYFKEYDSSVANGKYIIVNSWTEDHDTWNNVRTKNSSWTIFGDTFIDATEQYNKSGDPDDQKYNINRFTRYYLVKTDATDSPIKLNWDSDANAWAIDVQQSVGYTFNIVNNYTYEDGGTFKWEDDNVYRTRGDKTNQDLDFAVINNWDLKRGSDYNYGSWIINTNNTVKHVLTFTFDGFDGLKWNDNPIIEKNLPSAAEGYATFSSDYDVIPDKDLTAVQYASAVNAETGKITWEDFPATGIKTGDGALLTGTAGATYKFTPAASAVATSSNFLKPINAATALPQHPDEGHTNYILTNRKADDTTGPLGFYKVNSSGSWCAAGTAYLQTTYNASSGAREFFPLDDEITGIDAVKPDMKKDGDFYNLSGQKVAKPTKGLYIVNGKKVIM